jgi:hypothetical protein
MISPLVERVTALLRAHYPNGDIAVTEEPDGISLEVHTGNAGHLFASLGDERSAILVALESTSGMATTSRPSGCRDWGTRM